MESIHPIDTGICPYCLSKSLITRTDEQDNEYLQCQECDTNFEIE
jgi:formate dehydrogenase maturation protein FdhE